MSDLETYCIHLERLARRPAEKQIIPGTDPPITIIVFRDLPDRGDILGQTFGLSTGDHPSWGDYRPELQVCMRSSLLDWPLAIGYAAAALRGRHAFTWGSTIEGGKPLSRDTTMSALLICQSDVLEPDDCKVVLERYTAVISMAVPIYRGEIALIQRVGVQRFTTAKKVSFYDPRRPDTSKMDW